MNEQEKKEVQVALNYLFQELTSIKENINKLNEFVVLHDSTLADLIQEDE